MDIQKYFEDEEVVNFKLGMRRKGNPKARTKKFVHAILSVYRDEDLHKAEDLDNKNE